jgi:two-component system chemotaxis sensor kinase CheA
VFRIPGEYPSRERVVVIQHGDLRAGIVVDRLLGEFQTVIKPLGRLFRGARGLGGSTILGTGEVALILDVAQMVQLATESRAPARRQVPALADTL